MTDRNKLPSIFENGGLVAIYDFKLEQNEPSQHMDLSLTNPSKRNLEKVTVDNSEKTMATKRPKTRYTCFKCTFSTSVSTNLVSHMRSHGGMNGKFKCLFCDYSSNLKHIVDHHCARFHDKPITSSSKDPNINDGTSMEEELFVDVESISSNKELANNSTKAIIRKKHLRVKLFPSSMKINTRRSVAAAEIAILNQQGNVNLKTVGKSIENPISKRGTDSDIDVDKLADSADLLSRPKSDEKKSADIGVQTWIPSLNNVCQLSLEDLGKEEKTLHELISKLEADYENGKRSLTAAQLESASASELKDKLERCLEILSDGHEQVPSASVFGTLRCSAQTVVEIAIEKVEAAAAHLTDLSKLKQSQERVLKELLAAKIRLAKIEGMKSITIAENEVKKRLELLN